MRVRVGDRFRFVYHDAWLNRDLTVVAVYDDIIKFDDHTHCKRKNLEQVERLPRLAREKKGAL